MSRAYVLVCEDYTTEPMRRRTAKAALRKIERDQRRLLPDGLCQNNHRIVLDSK
jgi:hypothetical protein